MCCPVCGEVLTNTIAARRPEGHGGTFNLRSLVRRRLICLTLLGTLTPHLTYAPWYPRVSLHMYMVSCVPEPLWAACEVPRSVGQTALRLDMVSSKRHPIWHRDQPRLVRRASAGLEQPGAVPRLMRRGLYWRLPRAPDVKVSGGVIITLGISPMRIPSAGA